MLRHWMALLLLGCLALPAAAQAPRSADPALEISLITFGPGDIYWQRFGHNAILVRDLRRRTETVYNYGIFDFHQKHFFLNFARGQMLYRIDAEPLDHALRPYVYEGRWAVQQQLDLSPGQARELRDFLEWNLRPENVEYRYDYFAANCSTKVRDAIDGVLGGALRQQLEATPAGSSYRSEVLRLGVAEPWLMVGMDLGLGPTADRPLNLWQESFIPMRFMAAMRELRVDDGQGGTRPLVAAERELVPARLQAGSQAVPKLREPLLLIGLSLAGLLYAGHRLRKHTAARLAVSALSVVYGLLCGVGGLVLLAFWTLTEHWPTWRNLNLLLLNPLCLLLLPSWCRAAWAGWVPSLRVLRLQGLIAFGAIAATILAATPFALQHNLHWAFLLAPAQLVMWRCLQQRRTSEAPGKSI